MEAITRKTIRNLSSPNRLVMENSFNIIYKEYSSLVYYVSYNILHSKEDAEDIVSEVFMKMFQKKESIKKDKSLKYFLITMTKNDSISLLRKKEKEESLGEKDIVFEEKDDSFSSFVEKFKSFLEEEEISLIIDHLYFWYPFIEMAKERNVSINVVSSKYRRSIQKLKQYYRGKQDEIR